MAKLKVYAVLDSKVGAFAQPFFMRTRGEALRGWEEVANDVQTQIGKYPSDFALMELAEYDEASGVFDNLVAPLNLGLASQFKRDSQVPGLVDLLEKKNA